MSESLRGLKRDLQSVHYWDIVIAFLTVIVLTRGFTTERIRISVYAICAVLILIYYLNMEQIRIQYPFMITAIVFLLLISYAGISFFWSPSEFYARFKMVRLPTIVFGAFILGGFLAERKNGLILFIHLYIFTAVVYSIVSITAVMVGSDPWQPFGFTTHITLGRAIGLSVPLIAFLILYEDNRTLISVYAIASVICLSGLIASGTRQAVVAALLTVGLVSCYTYVVSTDKTRRRIRSSGLIASFIGLPSVAILTRLYEIPTVSRIVPILTGELDSSASVRLDLYYQALMIWTRSPVVGSGIGSYPVLQQERDIINYPHNVPLEVLAELGLIGFILFIAMIVVSFLYLFRMHLKSDSVYLCSIIAIFAYSLIIALFSRDIVTNRLLFFAVGIASNYYLHDNVVAIKFRR